MAFSLPSWDQVQMRGRHIIEAIDENPPPVRMSWYLGPAGMLMLLVATMVASSSAVCIQQCIRVGDELEDRLLQCMDRCEVSSFSASGKECEESCHKKVHYTRRQVQREMENCQKECDHMPFTLRVLAFLGVLAVLPVVPLLGSYRDACSCECCKGQGCSPKLALFNVAWTAYGFSTLWVAPSVAEDVGDVGGKVLFVITQGIAIASMSSSRRFAELAEAKAVENSYRMAEFGCTGAEVVGASVGAVGTPVSVNAFQDLQSQVEHLQRQVLELSRRQDLMQEVSTKAAPEAVVPDVQHSGSTGPIPELI
ncbi:unnamed protein product [Symbiodinium pilosum]|uniref:Transmembrane protein n=1 Tax=Symbiodinium pilosum TaxID=2952 RepID=A0A812UGK3_SYMPI|nr:unnamed protein product [Symbiodinium pilosum]